MAKKAKKNFWLWTALAGVAGALFGAGATFLLTRSGESAGAGGEGGAGGGEGAYQPAPLPPGTRERLRVR